MKERCVHKQISIISNHQVPEGADPGKKALNLPAPLISPQLAPIIIDMQTILPDRDNQVDSRLAFSAERVRIIWNRGWRCAQLGDYCDWAFLYLGAIQVSEETNSCRGCLFGWNWYNCIYDFCFC